MTVAIAGIGLATARGNSPTELPWEPSRWNVSRICYSALDSTLSGAARWRALVKKAFADLCEGPLTPGTPLFVGSCNGDASHGWEQAFDTSVLLEDTPWANEHLPVFTSSCASGIHALYAAKQLLVAGAIDQAVVLAADILSQSNHDNFESLRILAERPVAPWQPASRGFILGEAAVVLKLVRAEKGNLSGPELGSDLVDHDGLAGVVGALSPQSPSLIVGQGTGPYENDAAELSVFSAYVDRDVPLATPLSNFGHTLGASGLLAVALGALRPDVLSLTDTTLEAIDGRRLLCRGDTPWSPLVSNQQLRGGHGGPPLQKILTTCRALNGACAATMVGGEFRAKTQRRKGSWGKNVMPGPLMNQVLRRLASEAFDHRPKDPPDVFILRMEKPLSPPATGIIGNRLLPSAVLEITPGLTSQLVARCWGFNGPSLCLVGDVDQDPYGFTNALNQSGLNVFQVNLRGSGENRVVEWNI